MLMTSSCGASSYDLAPPTHLHSLWRLQTGENGPQQGKPTRTAMPSRSCSGSHLGRPPVRTEAQADCLVTTLDKMIRARNAESVVAASTLRRATRTKVCSRVIGKALAQACLDRR